MNNGGMSEIKTLLVFNSIECIIAMKKHNARSCKQRNERQ